MLVNWNNTIKLSRALKFMQEIEFSFALVPFNNKIKNQAILRAQ